MASKIQDYAFIGDCETGALVGRDGSIDWLCVPAFDSGACFAALLGSAENGRWILAPRSPGRVRRWYHPGTLILETEHETDDGVVSVIDFMPPRTRIPDLVRIVVGKRGRVRMATELVIRFDYGSLIPWVRRDEAGIVAIAGPDGLRLATDFPLHGEDLKTVGERDVSEGERIAFVMEYFPSHDPKPAIEDPEELLRTTEGWWRQWSDACCYEGEWREAVVRSLITLKALTHSSTGGIVAAPTTSLPEQLGGNRNWDYRFCWLRDATFTLYALMEAGYRQEACAWRDWLVRAVAGTPSQIQALYGLAGERRLTELELPWLSGYQGSVPVRIGNAAYAQLQLDVFGEVMDALHVARRHGLHPDENAWRVQCALIQHLESIWGEPDEGIWEIRGQRKHFTHSKLMAWVAFDRAVKAVERLGLPGPVERWRKLRDQVHEEVCRRGFDPDLNSFVQHYGSKELDASLLMIPLVGFLPPTDRRVRGTIEALQRHLMHDGFVLRYRTESGIDGLPPGEGVFFLCSFWLADNLALVGRRGEARELFERLLALRNDVGLLSEEYDPRAGELTGNFPQAYSHVALINSAKNLSAGVPPEESPSEERPRE